MKKFSIKGNLVILGFGSIGKGVLPLILRHADIPKERITIIEQDNNQRELADKHGIEFVTTQLTPQNYLKTLGDKLIKDSFVVNLTNDVSTKDIITLCNKKESLYVDTCIEPWLGVYEDKTRPPAKRTNYFFRNEIKSMATEKPFKNGPTALIAMGANPGLVSLLTKQALLNIAKDTNTSTNVPKTRKEWGQLARELNIQGIHIAERDHQKYHGPKERGEFLNTWSVMGFINEGLQPSELGWGTFEPELPKNGHQFDFGSKCSIYLDSVGMKTRVRSWTPMEGSYLGFLVTHNESMSLSDYYTVEANGLVVYRPSAYYCYHPSDAAIISLQEFAGRAFASPKKSRVLNKEITEGIDELGVLLYGHKKNAYWFGSTLSIAQARERITDQNATALQVTSMVVGSMRWAIENPRKGILEADELDYDSVLDFCKPYIEPLVGVYTDWNPTKDVNPFFAKDMNQKVPWAFNNIHIK